MIRTGAGGAARRRPHPAGLVTGVLFLAIMLILLPRGVGAVPERRADASRVLVHVRELAGRIGPRPAGTTSEARAADYVALRLAEYGYEVVRQPFTHVTKNSETASQNVIGIARGGDPRVIMVSAQLDTVGPDAPGANDNASGVAAMLEAARVLSSSRPGTSLAFVAFGATNPANAGAESLARGGPDIPFSPGDVALAINLDSVGRGCDVEVVPWGDGRALAAPDFRRVVAGLRDAGVSVRFDTTKSLLGEVPGDHSPLLAAGIPAVTVSSARGQTSSPVSPDPRWDLPDLVDGASIACAADAALALVATFAGGAPARVSGTYLAFWVLGRVVSLPALPSVVVSGAALVLGLLAVLWTRSMLYDEFSRVRPAGYVSALITSAATGIVVAVLIWTAFIPSLAVGAVRGVSRPWNAHPGPYATAGLVSSLFFFTIVIRLTGSRLREELRVPVLRLSILG
ncbi:MAG: M28 family peptidase, partial [Firmicutes bacterium]|nr:M28 family peptidase [Bacillota bacterium]